MIKYMALATCLIGWGVWGILEKKLLNISGNILINAAVYQAMSACVLTPTYIFLNRNSSNSEFIINYKTIGFMLGIIVFSGIASFACSYLIKVGESTSVVMTLTSLYPVVTLILAYIFLNETISIKQIIGILIILFGFILTGI